MRLLTLPLLLAAAPLFAQSDLTQTLAKHWKTSGEFTQAVAKAMPADGYTYKPNKDEMSFGRLMGHIALANAGACAVASGQQRPEAPAQIKTMMSDKTSDVDRDTALQYLKTTFDFCDQAVASMTTEKLQGVVGPPNRKMSGFEWLWSYFTHTAHHRGQAEVYLRMKGIVPPDYEF